MLSFGLINVPVSLYSATKKKTISFNQLRRSDYSRIRYKKVANDGQEVPQSEIVKGYEISPDRYAVITDNELAAIAPEASRVIEISDFVRLEQIDPRHYDASYYLVPEKGMAKAYALLLQAMTDSNVVGVAKFVLRSKEYLAAIRPADGALTLSTMLFADEIVKADSLAEHLPKNIDLSAKEVDMARKLIASLVTDFAPDKYKNDYHAQVLQLIDQKAKKAVQPAAVVGDNSNTVIDLMAALEASMAALAAPKKKPRKKATS